MGKIFASTNNHFLFGGRVARFFGTMYHNGKNIQKTYNIPNGYKIYQIAIK
jgi:hypothetical protein